VHRRRRSAAAVVRSLFPYSILEPCRVHPYTKGLSMLKREGRFHEVAGELSYDPDRPGDTRVTAIVNTASVDIKQYGAQRGS